LGRWDDTTVRNALSAAVALCIGFNAISATAGLTTRISVAPDGRQGNCSSTLGSMTPDGRYVSLASCANNIVPGDTNAAGDVFVHDRVTGTTERVSVASDGAEADRGAETSALSADGRFVAFFSSSTNLVPGDTNGSEDVFVYDRMTGATERVSVASDGSQSVSLGGCSDGASVAMSADGRYVTFVSDASNLVADDTNAKCDVFVHDRITGTTERVNVASDGSQADGNSFDADISGDG